MEKKENIGGSRPSLHVHKKEIYVHHYSVQMFGFLNFYFSQHSHLLRVVKTTTWPLSAVKPHTQIRSHQLEDGVFSLERGELDKKGVRRVDSQPTPQLHCHSCKRFGLSTIHTVGARDYFLFQFDLEIAVFHPLRCQLQMAKSLNWSLQRFGVC